MNLQNSTEKRFWLKSKNISGCWEWQATRAGRLRSYGYFWMDGRFHYAHRAAYLVTKGDIPSGMLVLHSCDNPICVRPDHLFLGTQKENMQDALRKGRLVSFKGEKNGDSRLKEKDVLRIRRLFKTRNYSKAYLSRIYGVSDTAIGFIVNRKLWKHI